MVELMVGLTIGLIVVSYVIVIFVNNKNVATVQNSMSRLQENSRFLQDLLTRDIRNAGARGCNGYVNPLQNNLVGGSGTYASNWGVSVEGYNHASGTTWSPALPSVLGALAPTVGTDVITVRRPVAIQNGLDGPMTTATADVNVGAGSGIAGGSIVIVADCIKATAFQVTNSTASVASSGLLQHAAVSGSPGNATQPLARAFDVDADVYVMGATTYYVAPSVRKAGLKALWAYSWPNTTGVTQPQELVAGVEDLEILYGVDTASSNAATDYRRADAVSDWTKVISVRASLLVATTEDGVALSAQPYKFEGVTTTPTDRRMRSVVNIVADVRNESL